MSNLRESNPSPADLQRVMTLAREMGAPTRQQRQRVHERVRAQLALARSGASTTIGSSQGRASAFARRPRAASLSAGWIGAGVLAMVLTSMGAFVGGYRLGRDATIGAAPELPSPLAARMAAAPPLLVPSEPTSSADESTMAAGARKASHSSVRPSSESSSDLPAKSDDVVHAPSESSAAPSTGASTEKQGRAANPELSLLRRAEKAIRHRNPEVARALLQQIDSDRARLVEERLALEVLASCQAQDPEAHRSALAFLRSHPRSVYRSRIQGMCGTEEKVDHETTDGRSPGH